MARNDAVAGWYAFKATNPGSCQEPKLSFAAGWRGGYRRAIADSAELGAVIPILQRWLELLETLDDEKRAVDMLDELERAG